MYIGYWCQGYGYARGDIVWCVGGYYICALNHISDNLTFPNSEDIHWIQITNDFFTLLNITDLQTLPSPFNSNLAPIVTTSAPPTMSTLATESLGKASIKLKDPPPKKKNVAESKLKRKLKDMETQLESHRKKRNTLDLTDLREQLLLLKTDMTTKSYIIDKYDNSKNSSGSDHAKNIAWLKTVSKLPYGKYKTFPVTVDSSELELSNFFKDVKAKLDKSILGLEPVKQEIMEYLARKITNPDGKGHVLALCGVKGVGKTKIIKSLASALDLPFYQINFGGLNDVNIITGHSETYVGSKPGKIVEILVNAGYMNPIIYLDEIDKMSETKSREINGILTHMLDEEQNDKFQDNYLSNINIDLSKVLFVIAFNDITKVDEIVSDRMTTIVVNPPTFDDKLQICKEKMIPEIIETVNFRSNWEICIPDDVIEHIIRKNQDEQGVRQLKKNIEKLMFKLNYDILTSNIHSQNVQVLSHQAVGVDVDADSDTNAYVDVEAEGTVRTVVLSTSYVNSVLTVETDNDKSYLSMYT
ncbi:AAA family ATPase [bacterium]|nr:AAA family ATPase [bacterium]